ncbi:hypothetical protein [Morganella psychrotolerans]|uniref:Uncharacterized protein n=1 Tax=Morganella psychrotolerans TaxID=368603 RepID=A0A1B8HNT3_9GAMM|nr:hypothetical protein [Morganella psychrotolerans]OBU11018.1 hypothetical protein AYY18_03525 [Morganella psychrotolerans]
MRNQQMNHYQTQGDLLALTAVTGDLLNLMKEIACNGSPELSRFIPTLAILAAEHCDKLMRDIESGYLAAGLEGKNHG